MFEIDIQKAIRIGRTRPAIRLAASIDSGKSLVIHSPSGTGKTTLLDCIAGFQQADSGSIRLLEDVWFDSQSKLVTPIPQRPVGYVLQTPSLFPHLSIAANLNFALTTGHDWPESVPGEFEFCRKFLEESAGLYPNELSGGQVAVVTLVRALLRDPAVLLLDEAFHGLDESLKNDVIHALRKWQSRTGCRFVVVSHDASVRDRLGDIIQTLDTP